MQNGLVFLRRAKKLRGSFTTRRLHRKREPCVTPAMLPVETPTTLDPSWSVGPYALDIESPVRSNLVLKSSLEIQTVVKFCGCA